MRIGIDVGGTHTDAVVLDGGRVVAAAKVATTPDIGSGIRAALTAVTSQAAVGPDRVMAVMLGTTQFANAIVEGERLAPVGVVRCALPLGTALPPLVDWPQRLRARVEGVVAQVRGGLEVNGTRVAPLDEAAVAAAAREMRQRGVRAVAVSSVFSPVDAGVERRAAAIVRDVLPDADVVLSAEIGSLGLLERENAAILNAALLPLARTVVDGFREALAALDITAPLYFTQNDGTLMSADYARRFPVRTVGSGPTNSMRGAMALTGEADAAVVDVGGTTTDVGVLVGGFPRPASLTVSLGGVRTNFRMPDVLSLGIGGGSRVHDQPVRVGPDSVGYRLTELGLAFGGDVATATDAAIAAGRVRLGARERVQGAFPDGGRAVLAWIQARIEEAIDRVKPSREALPVVVVGGGSFLVPDALEGASRVVRPEHYAVANAMGAALAQVGGEIDKVVAYEGRPRAEVLDELRAEAIERAVEAGADRERTEVVELEEVPLAYLPQNAARVRVRAVGDIAARREAGTAAREAAYDA
jgi:N-methylhydantoinase A/oxoprolinase/acetone carboxylase beta subunit